MFRFDRMSHCKDSVPRQIENEAITKNGGLIRDEPLFSIHRHYVNILYHAYYNTSAIFNQVFGTPSALAENMSEGIGSQDQS